MSHVSASNSFCLQSSQAISRVIPLTSPAKMHAYVYGHCVPQAAFPLSHFWFKFYGASSVLCVCRTSQHQALFACNLHRSSQGHALDQSDLWGLGIDLVTKTLIYHCASTSTAQPSDNALQSTKGTKGTKAEGPTIYLLYNQNLLPLRVH